MGKITVLDQNVTISSIKDEDYISLTDIARYKDSGRTDDLIRNWLRNRNTIEFLGIWEHLYNLEFKPVEFDGFKMQAGLNSFTLTPKQWIEKTRAVGIEKSYVLNWSNSNSLNKKLSLPTELTLCTKVQESETLNTVIRKNLEGLGYGE